MSDSPTIIPASVSLAAYAIALCLLGAAHATDGREPLKRAVSDYANGPASRLFVAYGLSGILGATALAAALWPIVQGWLPKLLAALAVLRLGVLIWPTDRGGVAQSRAGRLHLLFAVVTFALAYQVVSTGTTFARQHSTPAWNSYWRFMALLVPAALTAVVVTLIVPSLRRVFGLAERVFLIATLVWNASLAVALIAYGGLASVP